jgi:hypothetical protein
MDRLSLSDEDTEDLWNSPSQRGKKKLDHPFTKQESSPPAPQSDRDEETLFDRQEAREAALRNELQAVRNINQVIESLLGSLDRAKGNMEVRHPDFVKVNAQLTPSECLTNRKLCLHSTQYMDSHPISNGT